MELLNAASYIERAYLCSLKYLSFLSDTTALGLLLNERFPSIYLSFLFESQKEFSDTLFFFTLSGIPFLVRD